MKTRISATIEEDTLKIIKRILKNGKYRNSSHIIEEAIKKLGEKE